jgi:phosphoribosylamine--glycine ligase
MNVLLIGNGGREHALAWKLAQSKNLSKLYIAPGNPGTAQCGKNIPIGATEIDKLVDFARENKIGLVVVGPEDPLAAGAVDAFEAAGIKAFGPSAGAAQLEADKAFAKHLMRSSAISNAEGQVFERFADAKSYIASRDEAVVIKAAGLPRVKVSSYATNHLTAFWRLKK